MLGSNIAEAVTSPGDLCTFLGFSRKSELVLCKMILKFLGHDAFLP